ncbi:hypothetical protein EW145_g2204 [Phellinidium pouzarii]|uniref:Uncharacterized protein n=1 Tax=Phellinidium pouzarii TaxID=167371 RepID=A0A4S4LBP7_9AGAM|nr:hypothetical protein EW145_g2204 [Phellinidium pouzarii]
MESLNEPLVDSDNPLYCPDISAHQFLSSIRLFQASVEDPTRFSYFHRLCLALGSNELHDSPQPSDSSTFLRHVFNPKDTNTTTNMPVKKIKKEQQELRLSASTKSLKRQPDTLSSDSSDALHTKPFKRVKRSSSQIDMSFVLSAKADRLRFSDDKWKPDASDYDGKCPISFPTEEMFWPDGESKSTALERFTEESEPATQTEVLKILKEDLHGPELGPETPGSISSIVKHLDALLPGVRLGSQLDAVATTHQDIVNLLGIKGHLNPRILSLFQKANVYAVNLTESMADADGLNLLRNDTLKVFRSPDSFQQLRKIVLSDVHLSDNDLTKLSDLPRLETLFLDDTQIGDEAVMHLVALKHTLVHVELSWNKLITDDAIPSLCALSLLTFLSLKGTSITVKGLRKLAGVVKDRGRKISLILPSACEEYFCNLNEEYEVNITAPLICDPVAYSELKTNLVAHTARNASIKREGSKDEVQKRLRKLLERRQRDMVVQCFMVAGFK